MPIEFVEPIQGEHLRFHVRSRTDAGGRYLVDLSEFKLNGQCGCEDFQFGRQPRLKGNYEPSDKTRCWHIRAARNWLLNKFLEKLGSHHAIVDKERKTYILKNNMTYSKKAF